MGSGVFFVNDVRCGNSLGWIDYVQNFVQNLGRSRILLGVGLLKTFWWVRREVNWWGEGVYGYKIRKGGGGGLLV